MNSRRAGRALTALRCYHEDAKESLAEETVCDLLSDVGHYARISLGLPREAVVRIFARAIGAWSAEDLVEDGNPCRSDAATITLKERLTE